jgi:hypothetical protein
MPSISSSSPITAIVHRIRSCDRACFATPLQIVVCGGSRMNNLRAALLVPRRIPGKGHCIRDAAETCCISRS